MDKIIFIGQAWPYANGSLHLGHVSAFINADIIARYHRLSGDEVLFASGSDCYGTPIIIKAAEKGVKPLVIANKYHKEFKEELTEGLGFSYDIYTHTSTKQHAETVQKLFLKLYEKGILYTKVKKVLYSPYLERYLPDRYIEGICPKCGDDRARGDQCDECGALLDALDLLNPRINPNMFKHEEIVSAKDKRLEVRDSEHFYLRLSAFQKILEEWTAKIDGSWRLNARNFSKGFLKQGLHDRAITRDTDYGISVPVKGYEDKKIYVWFEAVTGYLSASKHWAQSRGKPDDWKKWWKNENSIHYYVHGKDNIPFHTIIWPAMLFGDGSLKTPDRIISSEYLKLEGKQFSTSRGWAVWLSDFLESFDSETLRYFLVVNGPESSDSNFKWDLYAQRVNNELIGTFGNLINRVLSLSKKHFPEGLYYPEKLDVDADSMTALVEKTFQEVGDSIELGKFRVAFKKILQVAENGNRFIDSKEPWRKIKDETKRSEVEADLAVLVHVIKCLAILVNPFLPRTSKKIYDFFGLDLLKVTWRNTKPQTMQKIVNVEQLFKKIEEVEVEEQYKKLSEAKKISEEKNNQR